ncbi:HAD hydrolase-like protein [Microbacterium sp. ZXX196]|uniref:HAD hydrolase-like protein n=1 Tax=Microbacterium sp. ZXX196 TaxID=2609291 RepID=UPI0012B9D702|nr:HAD hydrolase-like protein [Microbacterium sp. ZXX196]MTE24183.1 HAD hydrolase-like protein [Microbacterium sp. ZXX196]
MANSPWSCVLWDVDGTIADASAGILPRVARVLDEMGRPPMADDQVNLWIGPPMLESFQALAGLDRADAERAVARYRALAGEDGYAESVRLYDGVAELVREVHAAGIPQSTASTKPENQVTAILAHYGLAPEFDAIHGAVPDADVLDTKAHVLGRALADLEAKGVDVSRPVLVGDRHHDIDGAAEFGVPVIFARWGFGAPSEEAGSVAAVDSPADLRPLLIDG